MSATTARDVARYFAELAAAGPDAEPLSAGRLHRLLYLAQGWHLGAFGRPLFPDPFAAGPTVPTVDPADLGSGPIAFRDRRFADAVWERYRRYSAAGLRDVVGELPVEQVTTEALRAAFARAPELRDFDADDWEEYVDRERTFRPEDCIPLSEFMRRARARCATA